MNLRFYGRYWLVLVLCLFTLSRGHTSEECSEKPIVSDNEFVFCQILSKNIEDLDATDYLSLCYVSKDMRVAFQPAFFSDPTIYNLWKSEYLLCCNRLKERWNLDLPEKTNLGFWDELQNSWPQFLENMGKLKETWDEADDDTTYFNRAVSVVLRYRDIVKEISNRVAPEEAYRNRAAFVAEDLRDLVRFESIFNNACTVSPMFKEEGNKIRKPFFSLYQKMINIGNMVLHFPSFKYYKGDHFLAELKTISMISGDRNSYSKFETLLFDPIHDYIRIIFTGGLTYYQYQCLSPDLSMWGYTKHSLGVVFCCGVTLFNIGFVTAKWVNKDFGINKVKTA